MEKASMENMELGNLLWGHSRGEFRIDDERYATLFLDFLEDSGFDSYGWIEDEKLEKYRVIQEGLEWYYDQVDIDPETLKKDGRLLTEKEAKELLHSEYALENDESIYEYEGNYYSVVLVPEVDESKDFFDKDLTEEDFNFVSIVYKLESRVDTFACFENDVFVLRPYYWGNSEDILKLPNFVYKPTNFILSWYKHPLKDSYCNKGVSREEFKVMLENCKKSLQ